MAAKKTVKKTAANKPVAKKVAKKPVAKKKSAPKKAEPVKLFVRTVTYFYLGELVKRTDKSITLTKASWIADTGRFNEFMAGNIPSSAEIEMYPSDLEVEIQMGAVCDITPWKHDLPTVTK